MKHSSSMDWDENSPHSSQCPATSSRGRRNMEVKHEDPSGEKVELMLGLKTSRPKMSIELCSSVCNDDAVMAHRRHHGDDERGEDGSVGAHEGASQQDKAHTQTQNTKPKAEALVACRQLIDGSEAASLENQLPLPGLTPKEDGSLANSDPKRNSLRLNADAAESKTQYYNELCKQVEERKQQTELERSKNVTDEQKHIETMQRWGMSGSGAPNHHVGTTRRTNNLHAAGILPQEQVREKGFRGTPFRCP